MKIFVLHFYTAISHWYKASFVLIFFILCDSRRDTQQKHENLHIENVTEKRFYFFLLVSQTKLKFWGHIIEGKKIPIAEFHKIWWLRFINIAKLTFALFQTFHAKAPILLYKYICNIPCTWDILNVNSSLLQDVFKGYSNITKGN